MIRLLGRKNSIAVQKVLWTASEIGIKNLERSDVGGAFGFPESYSSLNPNSTVPTLIDINGFTLWESHAICKYLVSKYEKSEETVCSLYPRDVQIRAKVDQWLDWKATTLYPHIRTIYFTIVRTPAEKRNMDMLNSAKVECNIKWKIVNDELTQNSKKYLCGNSLTLADLPLAISFHRWHSIIDKSDRIQVPALEDW